MLSIALKQLEILNRVVVFHSISMVDYFRWQEHSPEMSFHHQPMLKNVVSMLAGIRVALLMN